VRRWLLCRQAIGSLISLLQLSSATRISIWIPFVRAFNNHVRTLILYRLNALVLDATLRRVLGIVGCKLSLISGAQILVSYRKESMI